VTSISPEDSRRKPTQAAVAFVFVTVLIDALSFGVIIPVLPKLVLAFSDGDTSAAARIYGLFGMSWALMQFLFSPFFGALSDLFGRRPVILLSNLGLGVDFIVMALAPSIGWLLVGRIVSGITTASIATGFAYVADVTEPAKRSKLFGMLGASFAAGLVFGPAIGGLAGSVDLRMPFWIAASLSLVNVAYGYFILPESLPVERRSPFSWRKANPIGAFALLSRLPRLRGLAVVHFLNFLAHASMPAVLVLYMTYRYNWDERTVGLAMAAIGFLSIGVQGGLVAPLVRRIGERMTLVAGLVFGCIGFALWAMAENGWWFVAGMPVFALWGLATPTTQALMSHLVPMNEQGRLQGAASSIRGIGSLFGPVLFSQVFAFFIEPARPTLLPGAPMALAAAVLVIAVAAAFRATREI
jgi:DHA1 family tetracycline resistance protein-like MFS transporter